MRKFAFLALLSVVAVFVYLFVFDKEETGELISNQNQSHASSEDTQPQAKNSDTNSVALKKEQKPIVERIEASTTSAEVDAICEELDTIARERRKLKKHEVERIFAIIKQDSPEGKGISADSWQLLMNSGLNAISSSIDASEPNEMTTILAHLARNASDPVIRLYALQHIAFWFPRETVAENRQLLLTVLRESSQDVKDTAGTALTVLSDLDRSANTSGDLTKDRAEISEAALKITNNPQASTSVRVSALHTLCDRNYAESLSSFKNIAKNQNEPVLLRKAAIFGIGKLGSKEDVEFLKSLPSINPRIEAAVKPAIQKLSRQTTIQL